MNNDFLKHLNERQDLFKLVDLSDEEEKHEDNEEHQEEDDEATDKDLEKKTKYKAGELTKYLQYVTASD